MMATRKLSEWEKVKARADYKAMQGRQFATVNVAEMHIEDWTDEHGKPIITILTKNRPSGDAQ
jgi:hypothetical protein